MNVIEKVYDIGENLKENSGKLKKGVKYGAAVTAVTGMLLGGSALGGQPVEARETINKTSSHARIYASKHIDRSKRDVFVDFHYHIRTEKRTGRTEKDPLVILDKMADEHGQDDGRTYDWERSYFSNTLDVIIPKLADFEYGDGSGEVRMTEYEKMKSDLRNLKMFDQAERYTKEYRSFYKDIKMTDRDEILRYVSPENQDIMYKTFREVFDEEIRRKKREGLPRAPEKRDPIFDDELIEKIIRNILREIFKDK